MTAQRPPSDRREPTGAQPATTMIGLGDPSTATRGPQAGPPTLETGLAVTPGNHLAAPGPGLRFGPYVATRMIGQGGMGKVFEARHVSLGRRVAIKTLQHLQSPMLLERFFAEARAAASIEDAGIVQVFDVGEEPEPYIVMELLEGETLSARISRQHHLELSDVIRFGRQIAGTLERAHAQGLIHRDIKPQNIFLIEDPVFEGRERTKVLDWGIAKIRASSTAGAATTASGVIMGTPSFMSPEQCRGAGGVDHRSDIYSLGCTLFCALTGRTPFESAQGGVGNLILAHMTEPPPAPSALVSGLPAAIDQIILKCLAKRPEARYVTMAALEKALRAFEHQYFPGHPGAAPRAGGRTATVADDDGRTLSGAPRPRSPGPASPLPPTLAPGEITQPSLETVWADVAAPPYVATLLSSLFARIVPVSSSLLELTEPRYVARRMHYYAYLEGSPATAATPLFSEELRRDLARTPGRTSQQEGSTIFVFTWATDIATSDRTELWRSRAFDGRTVVPCSLRELQAASTEGWARQLFLNTIRIHEHSPDPFKIDATGQSYELIGQDQVISEIVTLVRKPSDYMIVLSAPPAGGKSAALAEVRHHLGDHRCITVQCKNVSPLVPSLLAIEMLQQLQQHPDYKRASGSNSDDVFSDIIAALRSEKHDPLRTVVVNATVAIEAAQPWLLVLEDVDWAIEALTSQDSSIRLSAQSLWTGLAELSKQPTVTVLVTGVRTEQLRAQRIEDWRNPLKASFVKLPTLDEQQARHLVTKLGASVGFSPDPGAMEEIIRHGGGSAVALRILCSQILREFRRAPRYNPLSPVKPMRRNVRGAVVAIASSDQTFRHLFLSWLDKEERAALAYIAHNRPRGGLAEIVSICDNPDVLQKFEAMEIVTRVGHRLRVNVPLLEHWIRHQLPNPEASVRARTERRWGYAVGGISITALLLTSYLFKIRTERVSSGTDAWSVEFPERGYAGEVVSISIYEQPPRKKRSELIPIHNASAIAQPDISCDSHHIECRETYKVTLSEAAADRYVFKVVSDESTIDVAIGEDMLSSIRTPMEAAFRFLSGVPALLGMFVAFRQDLGRGIRALLGRGEKPAHT